MNKKKSVIIYVLPRNPWPPYAGQSILSFHRAKELKKRGYKLILISLQSKKDLDKKGHKILNKIFEEIHIIQINKIDLIKICFNSIFLRLFKNIPLQASWLNSPRVISLFKKRIKFINKKYENIFIHFFSIRTYALWNLTNELKKPFIIDLIDSMTLNIESKLLVIKENIISYFWKIEYYSIKYFENNLPLYKYCKSYFVVSNIDKQYLRLNDSKNKIPIEVHSIGIKISSSLEKLKNNAKKKEVIFFGSLDYEPNISAIKWLIKKVLPIVWHEEPNINLHIAGRNPTKELKFLSNKYKNILLSSNPSSMRDCMRNSIIAVAPLISGSGQQNKILEAMANELPVITTSKGALPFKFKDNKHLIIRDDPLEFANALISLLRDNKKRIILTKNALIKINEAFTWESTVNRLENSYNDFFK